MPRVCIIRRLPYIGSRRVIFLRHRGVVVAVVLFFPAAMRRRKIGTYQEISMAIDIIYLCYGGADMKFPHRYICQRGPPLTEISYTLPEILKSFVKSVKS